MPQSAMLLEVPSPCLAIFLAYGIPRVYGSATGAAYTFDISAYTGINTAPSDLNSTTALSILENQPNGSIVGEFNATDPDAGATLPIRSLPVPVMGIIHSSPSKPMVP